MVKNVPIFGTYVLSNKKQMGFIGRKHKHIFFILYMADLLANNTKCISKNFREGTIHAYKNLILLIENVQVNISMFRRR